MANAFASVCERLAGEGGLTPQTFSEGGGGESVGLGQFARCEDLLTARVRGDHGCMQLVSDGDVTDEGPQLWDVFRSTSPPGMNAVEAKPQGVFQRVEVDPETGLVVVPVNAEQNGAVAVVGLSAVGNDSGEHRLRCVSLVGFHVKAPRGCAVHSGKSVPFGALLESVLSDGLGSRKTIGEVGPGIVFNGASVDFHGLDLTPACAALQSPGVTLVCLVVENCNHMTSIWRVVFPAGVEPADADPADVLVVKEHALGTAGDRGSTGTQHNFPQDVAAVIDPETGKPAFVIADGANNRVAVVDAEDASLVREFKTEAGWPWQLAATPDG
jgi:hypothetical protein